MRAEPQPEVSRRSVAVGEGRERLGDELHFFARVVVDEVALVDGPHDDVRNIFRVPQSAVPIHRRDVRTPVREKTAVALEVALVVERVHRSQQLGVSNATTAAPSTSASTVTPHHQAVGIEHLVDARLHLLLCTLPQDEVKHEADDARVVHDAGLRRVLAQRRNRVALLRVHGDDDDVLQRRLAVLLLLVLLDGLRILLLLVGERIRRRLLRLSLLGRRLGGEIRHQLQDEEQLSDVCAPQLALCVVGGRIQPVVDAAEAQLIEPGERLEVDIELRNVLPRRHLVVLRAEPQRLGLQGLHVRRSPPLYTGMSLPSFLQVLLQASASGSKISVIMRFQPGKIPKNPTNTVYMVWRDTHTHTHTTHTHIVVTLYIRW